MTADNFSVTVTQSGNARPTEFPVHPQKSRIRFRVTRRNDSPFAQFLLCVKCVCSRPDVSSPFLLWHYCPCVPATVWHTSVLLVTKLDILVGGSLRKMCSLETDQSMTWRLLLRAAVVCVKGEGGSMCVWGEERQRLSTARHPLGVGSSLSDQLGCLRNKP